MSFQTIPNFFLVPFPSDYAVLCQNKIVTSEGNSFLFLTIIPPTNIIETPDSYKTNGQALVNVRCKEKLFIAIENRVQRLLTNESRFSLQIRLSRMIETRFCPR